MVVKFTFESIICLFGLIILIELDSLRISCSSLSFLLLLLVPKETRRRKSDNVEDLALVVEKTKTKSNKVTQTALNHKVNIRFHIWKC